jgi:AcrR family transcriptional regulator
MNNVTTDTRPDGRLERGRRTREAVLDAAVATASTDGLDGLSLGALAVQIGMSKSALFVHWSTKEQLQLAVIDHARTQWTERVIKPALSEPSGVRRLFALHAARLKFYSDAVLPGRCFFFTVQCEFDDRRGPVHDRVVAAETEWLGFIASLAREAITRGELSDEVSAEQLAFEIEAIGDAVVPQARLMDRASVFMFARQAVLDRLRSLCADPDVLPAR